MSNTDPARSEDWVGAADRRLESGSPAQPATAREPVRTESKPREPSAEDRVARAALSIAVLALMATVAGRWLPRGLPGSSAGIDRLIAWTAGTGAFVTQLFVLLGAALALRLAQVTVRSSRLMPAWRFGCPVLALAAILIILTATEDRLEPRVAVVLSSLVIVVALAATALLLASDGSRAVGIVLGLVSLAALARVTSLVSADHADPRTSPVAWLVTGVASSLACVLDLASLVVLALWLRAANARRWSAILGALALGAIVLALVVAIAARDSGAAAWQVVLLRSLEQTHAAPVPLVARLAVEILAFALACLSLLVRGRSKMLCILASLAIGARTAADVPALALCLLLASLLAVATAAAPASSSTANGR